MTEGDDAFVVGCLMGLVVGVLAVGLLAWAWWHVVIV